MRYCLNAVKGIECTKYNVNLEAVYDLLRDQNEREERDLITIIETLCMICAETFVDCDEYKNSEAIAERISELGFIDYEKANSAVRRGKDIYRCAKISLKEEYTSIEKDDYFHQLMILYISLWMADYDRTIYILNEMNKITGAMGSVSKFSYEEYLLESAFKFFCLEPGFVFCEEIWTEKDLAVFMDFAKPLMPINFEVAEKARAVQERVKNVLAFASEHKIDMSDNRWRCNNYRDGKKKWLKKLAETKSVEELEQIEKRQRAKDGVPINVWGLNNPEY